MNRRELLMSDPCYHCGTYHDTTACPGDGIVGPLAEQQKTSVTCTINGMTPFELALIERLDKLITVLTRHKQEIK